MEWREVRSPETGELLFRFWPERMLIEVMRRRVPPGSGQRAPEIVRLRDYLPDQQGHSGAGLRFGYIDGIDIEHEPV